MSALEPIPEQPEDIAARPAEWALVVTILAIAACVVVVWALDAFQLAGGGRSEVMRVDLVPPAQPFSEPGRLEAIRAHTHDDLDRWTWADRATGRARMPVDLAIDRYVSRHLNQRGQP
jgi:hypothetical protein